MITEDYVSSETAKLLKEKGFDGDTSSCYLLEDSTHHIMSDKVVQNEYYESQDSNEHGHLIQAPTLQMAMKWLREVHNIHISVYLFNRELPVTENTSYTCDVATKKDSSMRGHLRGIWKTYEEAVETAIKYCLEHLI